MGFKSNHRKPLARLEDIPEQGSLLVTGPHGEKIALFKKDDKVYALDDCCPHMDAPLSEGEVENGVVTCPWHGWKFQVDTGICLNMPGQDAFAIDLIVEEGLIYLRE